MALTPDAISVYKEWATRAPAEQVFTGLDILRFIATIEAREEQTKQIDLRLQKAQQVLKNLLDSQNELLGPFLRVIKCEQATHGGPSIRGLHEAKQGDHKLKLALDAWDGIADFLKN